MFTQLAAHCATVAVIGHRVGGKPTRERSDELARALEAWTKFLDAPREALCSRIKGEQITPEVTQEEQPDTRTRLMTDAFTKELGIIAAHLSGIGWNCLVNPGAALPLLGTFHARAE